MSPALLLRIALGVCAGVAPARALVVQYAFASVGDIYYPKGSANLWARGVAARSRVGWAGAHVSCALETNGQ